jgi:ubiquinone/menaquinone biosynthesis C-methylase UbiE
MSLETIDFNLLDLRTGERLLDLGCGEGRHAISAYLLADVNVIGVDLSSKDLNTAQQRLADFRGDDNETTKSCTFVRASGLTLPFVDNSFDKVICSEVLEHIPDYPAMLAEIRRVLKPGGVFAASVPRYFPEWVCWRLSDEYHEVEGGHVRIFTASELRRAIEALHMKRFARHWAHSLHVPYWWLRCLFWDSGDQVKPVRIYHRMLVWDLMHKPWITRLLDKLLNPIMGKSIVMYFVNEL